MTAEQLGMARITRKDNDRNRLAGRKGSVKCLNLQGRYINHYYCRAAVQGVPGEQGTHP